MQYYVRLVPELHDGEVETVLGSGRDITRLKQAEAEALRASEARLRAFVEATADTAYEMSPDWRTMYVLTGTSFLAPTREPRHDWLASYIPADEQPRVRRAIDQALATGQPFELEHRVIQQGGTVGWTYSYAMPLRDEAGQLSRWFGTARDITARQQAERQQEYLFTPADTLRSLSAANEMEATAYRLLGEWLGAHRVYYVAISEPTGTAQVRQHYLRRGAAFIADDYSIAAYGWTVPPLCRGEVVAVADVHQSALGPPDYVAAMEAVQQLAILLVPLVKDGAWVGVLAVGNDAPRAWPEADVALARETLACTWAAAQRARVEAALRASEAQFRAVANLGPDLLWRSTPDSETSWYNQRWYELRVYRPDARRRLRVDGRDSPR